MTRLQHALLLCLATVGCALAGSSLGRQSASWGSTMTRAEAVPHPALSPSSQASDSLDPSPGPPAFWVEDTRVEVNQSHFPGKGNIAWSHRGDVLAYMFGFSIQIVRAEQWDQVSILYRPNLEKHWMLGDGCCIAWSPDDTAVGVTVSQYSEDNPFVPEEYLAQVDRQRKTLAFLAIESTLFHDWSSANRMVAARAGGWGIFDVGTLGWQPLTIPLSLTSQSLVTSPTWMTENTLLWVAGPDPLRSRTDVGPFTFLTQNVNTNEWTTLPISATSMPLRWPTPAASPDGRWIAWIESTLHDARIMLYDMEQARTVETAHSGDYRRQWADLSWAPDSRQLAFSSSGLSAAGRPTIWILHLDQSP